MRSIISDGGFEAYQAEQSPTAKPFHKCEVILSFIGIEGHKAEFHSAYRVLGHRHDPKIDRLIYDLQELEAYQDYRNRLIIQWKTRGWWQKKDLDIYEILPATVAQLFPGYQEVLLSFEALKKIFADDRAHRDWKAALKSNAGIYRIVDLSTGEIYIGSAYGREGIWGRWQNYAKTGHGGNKRLKERDPKNFQWSIVRTASTAMSERDVIRIESLEKEKHGSRAIGLNEN